MWNVQKDAWGANEFAVTTQSWRTVKVVTVRKRGMKSLSLFSLHISNPSCFKNEISLSYRHWCVSVSFCSWDIHGRAIDLLSNFSKCQSITEMCHVCDVSFYVDSVKPNNKQSLITTTCIQHNNLLNLHIDSTLFSFDPSWARGKAMIMLLVILVHL